MKMEDKIIELIKSKEDNLAIILGVTHLGTDRLSEVYADECPVNSEHDKWIDYIVNQYNITHWKEHETPFGRVAPESILYYIEEKGEKIEKYPFNRENKIKIFKLVIELIYNEHIKDKVINK